MSYKEKLVKEKLPEHVAIIMDGNGRWAKKRGNKRIFGHKNGVTAVRQVTEACAKLEIDYLTLYAFSTENWNRPRAEIDGLMSLLVSTIHSETKTLMENNVKLLAIGDIQSLPRKVKKELDEAIEKTKNNTGLSLVLALSYSARWEIINAVKNIAQKVADKKLTPSQIDEVMFTNHLTTTQIPDPELLIRTSGENRISNFLLWQIAYTELYFTDVLWPDFREEHLFEALYDFQNRERRFGKISEQIR